MLDRRSFILQKRRSSTINNKRKELEKEYAEATVKLEQYQHKGQRLENRIKYYRQGDRKKRSHCLITRGAAVESVALEVWSMSERAFFFCKTITAVGIDVSKGKSTVAVRRPGGEVVLMPFQVNHDTAGTSNLIKILHNIDGEICVVSAMLIHDFRDNSLHKIKTGKADSLKIANYIAFWLDLREYSTKDESRQRIKTQCRLYECTQKAGIALRNSLISLIDQTFPGANRFGERFPSNLMAM